MTRPPGALPQITQRTLVISGDVDRILTGDVSGTIAAAIPGARLVRLEGFGHLPAARAAGACRQRDQRVLDAN